MNRISHIASLLLLAVCPLVGDIAVADRGHCRYMMYSAWLGRSLEVCQTADDLEGCGVWPTTRETSSWGAAEEKDRGTMKFAEGPCRQERVAGICKLSDSEIYFYEGNPEHLLAGCRRMQGKFEAAGADVKR